MSDDRTGSRGGKTVSDEAILEVFRTARRPFQTATDVAEAVGIERQSAHRRLQSLVEEGRVRRETVGAHAVVWWVPERERDGTVGDQGDTDPFLAAEPFASGRADVSAAVDEVVADAVSDESAADPVSNESVTDPVADEGEP